MFDQSWLELAELSLAQGNPDAAISYTEKMKGTNDERVLRLDMEAHYQKMLSCSAQYEWGPTFKHAERVRECCITLGFQRLPVPVDPEYSRNARYYSQAARYHVSAGSMKKELVESALSELQRQEERGENTHRDRILMGLIDFSYGDDLFDAWNKLIALVDDEEYARTLADKDFLEQYHYHCAIFDVVNRYTFGSKKNLKKAVQYLQRGISVLSDERIRSIEQDELRKYRHGIFSWSYSAL